MNIFILNAYGSIFPRNGVIAVDKAVRPRYNGEWFGALCPRAVRKVPKIGKIYIKKRRKLKHGKKKAFYGW
jgi:hypothetical protein